MVFALECFEGAGVKHNVERDTVQVSLKLTSEFESVLPRKENMKPHRGTCRVGLLKISFNSFQKKKKEKVNY